MLLVIVAILAGIALPAYTKYISETSISVVNSNYKNAVKAVKAEQFRLMRLRERLGDRFKYRSPDYFFGRADNWIPHIIDPNGRKAPGGGPAFIVDKGGTQTGAIGVEVGTGGMGTAYVNLYRPAYAPSGQNDGFTWEMSRITPSGDIIVRH
ncbi:hypothetical protein [Solemya velesiana gill symbiont]|uniref:hypothetical protein n=1 Tax=Solemya velesiana gill symbiont TaxID=1918948 RepID=UPI0010837BF1|nr:hypothetical protein [Solemya velesiana gill symbiont]